MIFFKKNYYVSLKPGKGLFYTTPTPPQFSHQMTACHQHSKKTGLQVSGATFLWLCVIWADMSPPEVDPATKEKIFLSFMDCIYQTPMPI